MAKAKPLTPEQFTQIAQELHSQLFNYGADLASLTKALVQKGLVTEAELIEAKNQVSAEMRAQIEKIAAATRRGPAGGVQ